MTELQLGLGRGGAGWSVNFGMMGPAASSRPEEGCST